MNFFIVSGLSGSGKTIALQALEDMGYYCIDNLPAVLLPHFAEQLLSQQTRAVRNAAVSIDSRNREFLESLPANLDALGRLGIDYRILFLEADENTLLRRYSETRRRHPLTDKDTPLVEGIRLERQLLVPLSDAAARHIDTTSATPHELRGWVRDFAGGESASALSLQFVAFGYKHGTPLDADFVFDVRCLPNPYWKTDLRSLSGLDPAVVDFLEAHDDVVNMTEQIRDFIERWLPRFRAENRSYITVAIGCTGGQHRSVYVVRRLSSYFAGRDFNVQTRYRELS
jgi:RNase adapter protein RapZ